MARSLSLAARNAAQSIHSDDGFLLLLTATPQNGETPPMYAVNNNENITSRGRVYVGWPFEINLPGDDDDRATQASLSIDNVDGSIVDMLRKISGDVLILLEVVLMSNPDDVVMATSGLKLRRITVTDAKIQGDLVVDNIYFVSWPAQDYTPASTPGIFR